MTAGLLQRVERVHASLAGTLLAELDAHGHWTGALSSSALSTATAVTALCAADPQTHVTLIHQGLRWLSDHANPDGGWGDTPRSASNLSTTALAWAAFGIAGADALFSPTVCAATGYLESQAGSLDHLVPAIERRYGKDRTFSVPITMALALSGRLGPNGWRRVRPLPFELALVPQRLMGVLRLPVVSYALPALIAIGQVIHHHAPRPHPLRTLARQPALAQLARLQPANGGFLEATPLTSFVTMSLAGMGLAHHVVAQRGLAFLKAGVRADGSWPIDTNLATWLTTLAVKALSLHHNPLTSDQRRILASWILGQQHRIRHPFTGAAPGGWAWTDLPGGVPDADDTAGALLALPHLAPITPETVGAATAGVTWLLGVQNADGGIPTFCRGWGTLPFDRSTPDLTAHALRAWATWKPRLAPALGRRIHRATHRAMRYLASSQHRDGSWVPLWFGNEQAPRQANPVLGTALVLIALNTLETLGAPTDSTSRSRAAEFLIRAQSTPGHWGGDADVPPSVEETALAVEALAGFPQHAVRFEHGVVALLDLIESTPAPPPAPIGLYFAQLWYYEKLYPLLFATSALGRVLHSATTRSPTARQSTP
ncbi:MAG TPA: prenyltransferase/squalene oxidase repeat-containing protein [Verrucomicrobiota bacterium]|nr:prenyltransferase/squalene oxidase repeat-containing protein [Verrucomicrobiota bacterium]HNU52539.1 prenyltransferase/squalene oxidase repeat-containing protein [Verrucomicrobiota bacterium]